ncbi:class I histocompatibility antigen, Gogo-B*0101 alpha chain-like [Clarias gariepinus]|uniref:patr class I histocompatibility antigen, B-1 alpha chain-like n=1 Tax=Clarias gariepinus TaxID=13013 RepID=UPI00234E0472|nr:patr class I histocompatibility antigen, B-1 alpha chain-like [Clarias gariepinus]
MQERAAISQDVVQKVTNSIPGQITEVWKEKDTHSLRILYIAVTPGHAGFPEFMAVGLLDGEQFMSYCSSNRTLIPKDWIKKIEREPSWESETQSMENNEDDFKNTFTTAIKEFNNSKGIHTLQKLFGCELNDNGTTKGYNQYAYDGEDFISLDLRTGMWAAAKPQAVIIIQKWKDTHYGKHQKHYMENGCIDFLKLLKVHGRETLELKVRPEVLVFHRHLSPSPEVVCHATGFFPKALNITWQKDGEDVHEDVELRETLPNQDGSFQKRSILKVPAEELQKHTYTCVVQHSSLEKELVREVPKGGRSDGQSEGGSGGAQIPIIAAVVGSLVALVAIVVGIVVWKKKYCGGRRKEADVKYSQNGSCIIGSSSFRPVPQNGTDIPEGDSSCKYDCVSSC